LYDQLLYFDRFWTRLASKADRGSLWIVRFVDGTEESLVDLDDVNLSCKIFVFQTQQTPPETNFSGSGPLGRWG
jgi:hypothetical protein